MIGGLRSLHVYVLCVTEICASEASLSHPAESQLIKDLVNYKDDATVLAIVMNSHERWIMTRFEKKALKSDPIHKNKKAENEARADRRINSNGWSAPGVLFIRKTEEFFHKFRSYNQYESDFTVFSKGEGCQTWWINDQSPCCAKS